VWELWHSRHVDNGLLPVARTKQCDCGRRVQDGQASYYLVTRIVFRRVSFSPNGQQIASGSDDGISRVWDVSTGKSGLLGSKGDGSVRRVAFHLLIFMSWPYPLGE